MSAPGELVRSSRWKSGPSKGQRPLGSECCVANGDVGCEAYTAIAWGVGLSHERLDIAGAEGFHSPEGNMCGTAMRGAGALPGSKVTSRAKGSHRDLGGLVFGRFWRALRRGRFLHRHWCGTAAVTPSPPPMGLQDGRRTHLGAVTLDNSVATSATSTGPAE
jgi:hypothetical protein